MIEMPLALEGPRPQIAAMEKPLTPGLRTAIVEAFYPVSANILADVCEGFGLAAGTREEAFSSKQRYVSKRLVALSREALMDLARRP
ncbi:hypothetical protein FJ420_09250 [Mesorhizobium sp. B3-1-3]|uniref:hypothetical protein n=1 Tax=unclassified Mesorhizobium TaxID=325217 RepID=UPI00112670AC|nr:MULTISPECIES: hypothetical protein [unclassified Mesorhizobium]TPI67977.1 hypothetical protein FJ424_08420 [Mesorhizobium sp. B3-1-8]TPI73577.1 hypothetical protein FJ420_09250 [Mesorhizobium sp. B3-1-3]